MPTVQASGLNDLVKATQNELGEMKFTDISTDLNKLTAMSKLMKKSRVEFNAGPLIQFDVNTDHNNSARFTGLWGSDNVAEGDSLIQGQVPWRHMTANYAIERREVAMNRSPRTIVSLVKLRRLRAMIAVALKMEERFWKYPASTDEVSPYGVPYWVCKNASEGFNGGTPSGYTTVGGINPTTYSRWKNWTAGYTNVDDADFIAKAWKASEYTDFEPPVQGIPTFNTGDSYGFYTNYALHAALKQHLMGQNEDLGADIDPMGNPTLRRVPIQFVRYLDNDTTNPLYGINFGVFKTTGLRGEWGKETVLENQPGKHTVSVTHIDWSFNFLCWDRRRNFVISNGTTEYS